MSSVTTTLLQPPLSTTQTCPDCGADLSHIHPAIAEDAQRRISELETQVRMLTGKATAAVDKLADYEDELRQLKSAHPPSATPPPPPQPPTSPPPTLHSRISLLLPSLHSPLPPQPPPPPQTQPPSQSTTDLLTALTREQSLRQAAETRVSQTNDEIEELSAQLFTEANEMVATERKARAKLEERVAVLEGREREKRGRLEVLEARVGRIERVRRMLEG